MFSEISNHLVHSQEKIERQKSAQHRAFMKMALDFADASSAKGNHPFGAALVVDGCIVLSAENTVITDHDVTAHAEMNLIRSACRVLDSKERNAAILYASTEPCAMCAGAIYWAGIRSVVYGCSVEDLAQFTTGSFVTPCREIFARGLESTKVEGPCCRDRAKEIHRNFWRS